MSLPSFLENLKIVHWGRALLDDSGNPFGVKNTNGRINTQDHIFEPDPDGVVNLSIGGTSARLELPSESETIRLEADVNCYYRLGGNTVTVSNSNGTRLPAGVEYINTENYTYIAVIQDSIAGNLNITKVN